MKPLFAALFIMAPLVLATGAQAALTRNELDGVSLSPAANAAAPLALKFRDIDDRRLTLREAIGGRPSLLLFVDYTCRTICGPALAIASGALAQTGLDPAKYRLVVIGLDPKDSAKDARLMARQIGDPAVERVTILLRGDAGNVHQLTDALGYRYRYDAAADQFAHPAGALVMTADGRVSRALSSLALNPRDLRLALVEAGAGHIGTFADRLTLLCYGFDAAHGVYAPAIARMLKLFAALTVICVLGAIAVLERRRRMSEDIR
ncbi:SCO family protein (plasmid) [Nitrobacter sp. NHB1]|uniref:SCO family protein n=1 Tax=Nitrobacter sp. NHB1 TaxID=3119830 RepID=UPI002FFDE3C0